MRLFSPVEFLLHWLRRDLSGRFEFLKQLNCNAVATVSLVRIRKTQEVAVLKLLHSPARALRGPSRETLCLQSLHHEHIVRLLDHGSQRNGEEWILMEYIEGPNLAAWLEQGESVFATRLAVIKQIASGLAYLHWQGWIHGDLRPENVQLRISPLHAVLIDLQHSRLASDRSASSRKRIHSIEYASPEELSGSTPDFLTDQFSFGALGIHILGMSQPLESQSDSERPCDPTGEKLRLIMQRASHTNREMRYKSILDILEELQSLPIQHI